MKRPRRRKVGRPPGKQDLRDTLLRVTLELLGRAEDPATVTIARIVEAAGCTPPSLYHYWSTREALLLEAGARGWEAFRRSQRSPVRAGDGPLERIRARGRAYLAFARERPSLFRALFLREVLSPPSSQDRSAPGPALSALVSDVAEAMELGLLRRAEPTTVALALWASVHGFAVLIVTNPELPDAVVDPSVRLQQDALLAGLAGPGRVGGGEAGRR